MPARGSSAATSMTSPPRTQPSATRSLKKIARGFCSPIRRPCRLPREKTSSWESSGRCSASSVAGRNPARSSNANCTRPSASCVLRTETTLSGEVVEYAIALSSSDPLKVPACCPRMAAAATKTQRTVAAAVDFPFMPASTLSHLECPKCHATFEYSRPQNLCRACGSPLLARYDLEAARATLTAADVRTRVSSMWRYEEVLPPASPVSLGEGMTPLVHARRLGEALGLEKLFIKDEGQ